MIITGIVFIVGLAAIGFLFLVHNAMSKPIYNKMYNVWEEDPEGKKYADITLIIMLIIAFLLGLMI